MLTKAEEYLSLVGSEDDGSRKKLRFGNATESVWLEIIAHHPHLKRTVTLNKSLPEPILRLLAKDADPAVRTDIAMKRTLPRDVFELLATDTDESVRARVALNQKTPHGLLQKLAGDVSWLVAESAQRRLGEK